MHKLRTLRGTTTSPSSPFPLYKVCKTTSIDKVQSINCSHCYLHCTASLSEQANGHTFQLLQAHARDLSLTCLPTQHNTTILSRGLYYSGLDVLDVVTSGSIWNTRIIVITIFSRTIARVIFQQHTTTRYFVLRSTHLPSVRGDFQFR
ncbi:predicted protein [Lichtheimia corymbifera JMRC:FSU:9682]|uniref:Uncharacterized protein n=1 Tax=Lichtheimia corymbifera JMRC:FSU:9682 TaxID=1263082 RepID=A0A068SI11_9FUNG|nr:predicted protein [Lichtheimia corymbifera JMRC:FSU:9682]